MDSFIHVSAFLLCCLFPLSSAFTFFSESSNFRVQQITDTIVGRLLELTRVLFKIRASTDFLLFQLAFASQ